MKHPWAVVFATVLVVIGCGRKTRIDLPPPTIARLGATETGAASWYGHPYHGQRTSNGEIYDMDRLTAAHLTLPFDTKVRVRNLANGRTVDVRINDRGPFKKGRLIDLSREAATRLGMIGPGTTRVEVTVIATPKMTRAGLAEEAASRIVEASGPAEPETTCAAAEGFAIQVGSFAERRNAERLAAAIETEHDVWIRLAQASERPLYRVTVGRRLGPQDAQAVLAQLKENRIEGFVTRLGTHECGLE